MNTVAVQSKTTLESQISQAGDKDKDLPEAIKELSSIELAYVGGGTASVIFY
jgi:hypothetical protein